MKVLMEKEAEDFLEKRRFPVVRRFLVKNEAEANEASRKVGFPLVLKVVNILHKSDINGVKINIAKDNFKSAYYRLVKKSKRILVQEQIEGKLLLVGLKKDPVFGYVIALGSGGIYTEVLKDVSFRICPVNERDAEEMLSELKIYPVLKGTRGEKPVNFNAVKSILLKTSRLSKKYKIRELDINPLIVNHKEAKVADARIIFE